MVRPYLRTMKPMPPPVVSPPRPTDAVSPVVSARPYPCASPISSPELAPACARAIRVLGSMLMLFMPDRSMTSASSIMLCWLVLWPPLRTASA